MRHSNLLVGGPFQSASPQKTFGKIALTDAAHNRAGHSIHNHFIIKSLDLVRPGGLVCVVTSRFTADARNTAARAEIIERADLVGAVRLPQGAFRAVAGTDVAVDVLLLWRRPPDVAPAGIDWLDTTPLALPGGTVAVNEMFAAHPDWVIGDMVAENGQYNATDLCVQARPGPLADQLRPVLAGITAEADGAPGTRPPPSSGLRQPAPSPPPPPPLSHLRRRPTWNCR